MEDPVYVSMENLEEKSYRELQIMAKSLQLPSNVRKVYLIQMILAKTSESQDEVDKIVRLVRLERKRASGCKSTSKKKGLKTSRVQGSEITSTNHVTPTLDGSTKLSVSNANLTPREDTLNEWTTPPKRADLPLKPRQILPNDCPLNDKNQHMKEHQYKDVSFQLQNIKDELFFPPCDAGISQQKKEASNSSPPLQIVSRDKPSISRGITYKKVPSTSRQNPSKLSTNLNRSLLIRQQSRNSDRVLRSYNVPNYKKPNYCLMNDSLIGVVKEESKSNATSGYVHKVNVTTTKCVRKIQAKMDGTYLKTEKRVITTRNLSPPEPPFKRQRHVTSTPVIVQNNTHSYYECAGVETHVLRPDGQLSPIKSIIHRPFKQELNDNVKSPLITFSKNVTPEQRRYNVEKARRNMCLIVSESRQSPSQMLAQAQHEARMFKSRVNIPKNLNGYPKSQTHDKFSMAISTMHARVRDEGNYTTPVRDRGQQISNTSALRAQRTQTKVYPKSQKNTKVPKLHMSLQDLINRNIDTLSDGINENGAINNPLQALNKFVDDKYRNLIASNENVDKPHPNWTALNEMVHKSYPNFNTSNEIAHKPYPNFNTSNEITYMAYPNWTASNEIAHKSYTNMTVPTETVNELYPIVTASIEVFGNYPNLTVLNASVNNQYPNFTTSNEIVDNPYPNLIAPNETVCNFYPNLTASNEIVDNNYQYFISSNQFVYSNLTATNESPDMKYQRFATPNVVPLAKANNIPQGPNAFADLPDGTSNPDQVRSNLDMATLREPTSASQLPTITEAFPQVAERTEQVMQPLFVEVGPEQDRVSYYPGVSQWLEMLYTLRPLLLPVAPPRRITNTSCVHSTATLASQALFPLYPLQNDEYCLPSYRPQCITKIIQPQCVINPLVIMKDENVKNEYSPENIINQKIQVFQPENMINQQLSQAEIMTNQQTPYEDIIIQQLPCQDIINQQPSQDIRIQQIPCQDAINEQPSQDIINQQVPCHDINQQPSQDIRIQQIPCQDTINEQPSQDIINQQVPCHDINQQPSEDIIIQQIPCQDTINQQPSQDIINQQIPCQDINQQPSQDNINQEVPCQDIINQQPSQDIINQQVPCHDINQQPSQDIINQQITCHDVNQQISCQQDMINQPTPAQGIISQQSPGQQEISTDSSQSQLQSIEAQDFENELTETELDESIGSITQYLDFSSSLDFSRSSLETLDADWGSVHTSPNNDFLSPEPVLDYLEPMNQNGHHSEQRREMDVRMQCILCSWAGPKIILEHHIRKEHADDIMKCGKNEWVITYRLGSLVNQQLWLSTVIEYEDQLYALSVKYQDPEQYMAAMSMVTPDPNPKTGSITMFNKVSGKPFQWKGEIPTIHSNMPYDNDNMGLTLPLSSLDLLPNRENLILLNRELVRSNSEGSEKNATLTGLSLHGPAKVVVGRPELNDIQVTMFIKVFY